MRRIRRARKYTTGTSIESLTALTPGDYVVHLEHGVGIYRGIEKIFVRESTVEAAVIEYEGGSRLNVPLYRIDQIEQQRATELQANRHLRLSIQTLSRPDRIEHLAAKLRLAPPSREDTVILERVVPGDAPAQSIVAQRQ